MGELQKGKAFGGRRRLNLLAKVSLFGFCMLFSCLCFAAGSVEDSIRSYLSGKQARVGVAWIGQDGRLRGVNAEEEFPMLSVMKFPLAMAVADKARERGATLKDSVLVQSTLLHTDTYSPMLEKYSPKSEHKITLSELLYYSLSLSDNNACDVLLDWVGGAAVVQNYMERLGFDEIKVKWTESDMHSDLSLCQENTSTPEAMARLLLSFDRDFKDSYSKEVKQIMENCKTGKERLPAALFGKNAVIGHKTGTGDSVDGRILAVNDAGYIRLSSGENYAIAVFVADSKHSMQETEAIIAHISRLVLGEIEKE